MLMADELGQLLSEEVCVVTEGGKGRTKGLKGEVGFTQLSEGLTLDS